MTASSKQTRWRNTDERRARALHNNIVGRQDDDDDVSEPDDSDEELIFMSLLYDRKRLGVAIYDAVTTGLKTLEISVDNTDELDQVCSLVLRNRVVMLNVSFAL